MKIIVALSGGPDSVTLLHKLNKENHNLLAVHFNHNLRETAKRDEIFVSDLCKNLNIPLKIISLDIYSYVKEHKTTIEEGARELRYKHLFNILKEKNFDKIALGHNLNDKCETILMNIVRGTGIDGLNGLKAETGSIIRPIINMTKDEILQYLKENNLSYCTDETNLSNDYTRNKFRNIIIPELLKINSGLFGNLSRLADIAKETEDYMACETEKALLHSADNEKKKIPHIYQGGGSCNAADGGCFIPQNTLSEYKREYILSLHPAIQHRLIKEIIVRAKGTTKDVSQKEVLRLCHLIEKGEDFKTFLDSGKIYAQLKNGIFSVEEKKAIQRPNPFEYKITEPETYIKELDKTLIIRPIDYETEINSPYLTHPKKSSTFREPRVDPTARWQSAELTGGDKNQIPPIYQGGGSCKAADGGCHSENQSAIPNFTEKTFNHPQSSLWDASPLINRGQQSVSPHRENKNRRFYFNINELNDFKIKNIETKIRFQPIGMTGTKKIGNILSDKKIPIETRYMNIILMSRDMPLWIPYVITSEKGKCKSPTHYIELV